ncbi:Transposon ty1-gr2 gag-pol polyprotein, partial [Thalictrum thalictroides]
MSSISRASVILHHNEDWEPWIELIKTSALKYDVWKYVDPDSKNEDIPSLTEPKRPSPSDIKAPKEGSQTTLFAELDASEKEEYSYLKDMYNRDVRRYERQCEALGDLRIKVQESIHVSIMTYTHGCDSVRQMLVNLANTFAPNDENYKQELEEKWANLQKRWTKGRNVEEWVHEWEVVYYKMAKLKLAEVQGMKPVRNFLSVVSSLDQGFADMYNMDISKGTIIDFPTIIKVFKSYRRTSANMLKSQPQHGAFPTLSGFNERGEQSASPELPQSNPNKAKADKCPCGNHHFRHRPNTCWYVIPSSRPKDWKPDPEKSKKVTQKIDTDPTFRNKVEEWRKNWKPKKDNQSSNSSLNTRPDSPPVVAMATSSRMSAFTISSQVNSLPESYFQVSESVVKPIYDLQKSWILDSGATLHVCNDKAKLEDFKPSSSDVLWAGDTVIPIIGYGSATVKVKSPKYSDGRPLKLVNVACVPNLHTSVVSLRLLIAAGIHWDTRNSMLTYNDKHYADTPILYNQWVLQFEPISHIDPRVFTADVSNAKASEEGYKKTVHGNSSKAQKIQRGTYDDWHVRMGHLNDAAMKKLHLVTKGCEITTNKPERPVCEGCRMINSKRIISRNPRTRATRPFWRVSWDLIQMNQGSEGEVYVMHFLCDFTRMHFVYILPNKLQDTLLNTFITFSQYVKRRWGFIIVVWKGDGEKSLGTKWLVWINGHGYEVETSSPHTQDQNGDAERSGGVLQIRGAELLNIFGLPDSLWKEVFPTAGYLLNRSPLRSLGFKTPLGFLKEYIGEPSPEPSIAHLQPYGCKAFAHIKNRPKLSKLTPRAEIGYLVGYDSTNIFRIWIPSRKIVISTRDVTFDPSQGYSPNQKIQVSNEIIETIKVPDLEVESLQERMEIEQEWESRQVTGDNQDKQLEITSHKEIEAEEESDEDGKVELRDNHSKQSSSTSNSEKRLVGWKGYVEKVSADDGEPTQEIHGDPNDPRNIIQGKRKRSSKVQFHMEVHENLNIQAAFHAAFFQGTRHMKSRIHEKDLPPPPENWYQVLKHPHREGFAAAARLEFDTLKRQETFREIPENEANTKPIPVKWVFTYKIDDNGFLLKYKARMVIRGDLQIPSEKDTYAATLAIRMCRAVLSIVAYFDLEANQFDVTNAFPHADLDEDDEINIQYPDGFKVPGSMLRVMKALYGLSVSPRLWYNHLVKTLSDLGFKQVPESGCVFCSCKIIVCFYVDDIAAFYHMRNKDAFNDFKRSLFETYTVKDIGELKWFLGLRIVRDRAQRKLWLLQDSYIEKVARKFARIDNQGYLREAACSTPMSMEEIKPWDGTATDYQIHEYQRRIGSLTYASVVSRPDIAKSTQKLAEVQMNPSPAHFEAANRVIDYLYNTRFLALEYGMSIEEGPVFIAASDASFGDNVPGRTSSEAGLFKLFGGVIDYHAKKQRTVTTSSTESELLALSHLCAWLKFWDRFFRNLTLDVEQDLTVWCDNLQTVRLMLKDSPKLVTKLRHVDIHQHWLRQECQNGTIKLEWIETSEMPADGLTKCLSSQRHQVFLKQLNMVDIKSR